MLTSPLKEYRPDKVVVACGVALAADCVLRGLGDDAGTTWRTVLGWSLALVGWLVLGFRYSRPVPVGVVTMVAAIGYYVITEVDGPSPMIVFMVSLYNVARAGMTAVVALGAVMLLAVAYGEFIADGGARKVDNISLALLSGWFLSVVAFGHAMRVRQAYQAEVEQRALAAERERDARTRQSAVEERLRIARELHDVLGHHISLINVQSAATLHRNIKRPDDTERLVSGLQLVHDTSREALRELRATLGVLRQVDEAAPTSPVAGLDRLGELADRASAAGLRVTVDTTGTPRDLPAQISLAAYRIVQESLTNVTRHARADEVRIEVAYAPDGLRLRIDDDGRGAVGGTRTGGSGIAGMAERARALGGELTAGNADTGFRVAVRLPLDGRSPHTAEHPVGARPGRPPAATEPNARAR
ncbi:sensor histidine kinase [Streptomyces sp. NPDC004609]|uniref:sensor histidine kinase n=1 Tax=Streptomyces sp. NPDC004609 TaxID=3364704 RepID=UPI0036CB0928